MSGQRKRVGARNTYFPPFVNELFDGPPWWACTFAALLNGANVGYLGNRPARHSEVRALAKASGDVTLRGGSRSSHMIRAMRARYGKRMAIEALPPKRAQERLASGWAMVAAVTYGDLPVKYRRWSKRFKGGHRVTLIGWNGSRTVLLDPLARMPSSYTGEEIPWSQFERAWWSGEQLWFAEGMFRKGPDVRVLDDVPEGQWRIPAGSRLVVRSGKKPQIMLRKVILAEPKSGRFDALVELVPKAGQPTGPFLRVSSGALAGMLIPAGTKNINIRPKPGPSSTPAPKKQAAGGKEPHQKAKPAKPIPADLQAAFLEGRKVEYERIQDELGPVVNLPPPPT